jgi:hypothetical protein
MSSPSGPPRRLIPWLVLGGFVILLLSWLAFMTHYVRRVAHPYRGVEPAPRVSTNPPPGGP